MTFTLFKKIQTYIHLYFPRHALTCPPSLLLCKIHDSTMQPNLPKQVFARPIACFIEKDSLTNHQFRNDMFHSQIGTRNETLLNVQLWNKLFHLQTGTRNKTVLNFFLNDQLGNKVFHSQKIIRNKTYVLNYQFGYNVIHLQMEIRNKTVQFINLGTNCSMYR